MHRFDLLLAAPLLVLLACVDGPEGGSDGSTGSTGSTSVSAETGPAETGSAPTGATASSSDEGGSTSGAPGTSSGDAPTSTTSVGDESSTAEVPTRGPGVLPGETGQEAMCRRAFECGSTYYADEAACIEAGTDYWGECTEVTTALDAFGACMAEMACEDYDPDAYNPANTPCNAQWGALNDVGPC